MVYLLPRTFQLHVHVYGFPIFLLMSVPNEGYSKKCIMGTNFDIYILFIIETPFSNRDQDFSLKVGINLSLFIPI